MPIFSYLAYPVQGAKEQLINDLAALDFCEARDVDFEWHFFSGYHPGWLEDVGSVTEKARYQVENSKTVLRRYGDRVRFFQVINDA